MSRRCLNTHTLEISKLKGVSGLQEIQLDKKPITGIFGPNGVGKSTILHALAAAYVAPKGAQTHDFKSFFPQLADDVWDGSNFQIEHTIKTAASDGKETTKYTKGTATTRWTPTSSKRPTREVCFIGLRSVVPSIRQAVRCDRIVCRITRRNLWSSQLGRRRRGNRQVWPRSTRGDTVA